MRSIGWNAVSTLTCVWILAFSQPSTADVRRYPPVPAGEKAQTRSPESEFTPGSTGQSAPISPLVSLLNGDFETGSFTGWTVANQAGSSGTWYVYSGTVSPYSGYQVAAPPQGQYAAISDQTGPGRHTLYRDITLPAGQTHTLSMRIYYYNRASAFSTPSSLSYEVNPNQQLRVDIMKPTAALDSLAASDVLGTVFRTRVGDPLTQGPKTITYDLTPFAGSTVRLRVSEVDNASYFQAGVDAVSVNSVSVQKPVILSFSATPSTVPSGGTAELSWTTTGGTSATLDPGAISVPLSGSRTVTVTGTTTYTLTVTGAGGTATAETVVSVLNAPAITKFEAAPATVFAGQMSTLTWESTNASTARIDPGALQVPTSGSQAVGPLTQTTEYTLTVQGSGGSATKKVTVTVDSSCVVPSPPAFPVAEINTTAGQSPLLSWSPSAGLLSGGTYELQVSRNVEFVPVESTVTANSTSALIQTVKSPEPYTLYARVRANQTCGSLKSAFSTPLKINVQATPASFLFISGAVSWSAAPGGTLPAADIWVRNVGGLSATINFSFTGTIPGTVSLTPASLTLGASQDGTVKVLVPASVLSQPGSYSGVLSGRFSGGEITLPFTLTVLGQPTDPDAQAQIKVRAATPQMYFSGTAGANPPSQTLRLFVDGMTPGKPAYLQYKVSAAAWLRVSGPFSSPVPENGIVDVTVSIDRTKRTSQDGVSPFAGYLSVGPAGQDLNKAGIAALVRVTDSVPPPVKAAAGQDRVGSQQSFIIPSVVYRSGQAEGSQYSTDGWISNLSPQPAPVELFFTPAGKDGVLDAGVLKATTEIPAQTTMSLANLLQSVFQFRLEDGMYGALQIKSDADDALVVRVVTNVSTAGDPTLAFRDQLPATALGLGAVKGGPSLFIAGISANALWRTNLLLVETSGHGATMFINVRDKGGRVVGSYAGDVLAYGLLQLSVGLHLLGGGTVDSGSLEVLVNGGQGTLSAYATVVSNLNGSFTTIPAGAASTASVPAGPPARPAVMAGPVGKVIFPAMARIPGFNVDFLTSFKMVNSQDATKTVELTLFKSDGTQLPARSITLGPKETYSKDDFLKEEFNLTDFVGRLEVGGDVSAIWKGGNATLLSTPSTGNPPSTKIATLPSVFMADETVAKEFSAGAKRYVPGLERSSTRRNSLILVETAGTACDVDVQVMTKEGKALRSTPARITVPANFYRQINDFVVASDGLQLESLRDAVIADHRVEITIPANAGCRVIPLVTHVDNNSGQSEISDSKKPGSKNIK